MNLAPLWNSERLSRRERQVLELRAAGMSLKEIASKLGIAYYTVETHSQHACLKMGTRSPTFAVAKALRHHLIDFPTRSLFI